MVAMTPIFFFLFISAASGYRVLVTNLADKLLDNLKLTGGVMIPGDMDQDSAIEVEMDLSLKGLVGLRNTSEGSAVASFYVQENYTWTETGLTWRPYSYDNWRYMLLPHERLWTPDVILDNPHSFDRPRRLGRVRVQHDGLCVWRTLSLAEVPCYSAPGRPGLWQCVFEFRSQDYNAADLLLSRRTEKSLYLGDYVLSADYFLIGGAVKNTEKFYTFSNQGYPSVIFNVTVAEANLNPDLARNQSDFINRMQGLKVFGEGINLDMARS